MRRNKSYGVSNNNLPSTKNSFWRHLISIFLFIIVFWGSLYYPADSDLGWHLKYGQYFIDHGKILRENIFSSSMADYRWINHSWGTDVLTYLVFNNWGFWGLAVAGGIVAVAIFFFYSQAANLNLWQKTILFPILVILETPLFFASFRGQMVTVLGIGLLLYLLNLYRRKRNYLQLCMPLFLVWANLHGGFVLGLIIYLGWFFLDFLAKLTQNRELTKEFKNEVLFVIGILLVSIGLSLINPFGFGVYQEAIRHLNHMWLRAVGDWTPLPKFTIYWWQLIVWGGILIVSIIHLWKKRLVVQQLPLIGLVMLTYIMSIDKSRYVWPMYLISIPIVAPIIEIFRPKREILANALSILILVISLIYSAENHPTINQIRTLSWSKYCELYIGCSPQGAEYLVQNKPTGRLMTLYDWGGWLIWNYPEIKPSIDGRMHLWTDGNYSAFGEQYIFEWGFKDIDKSTFDEAFISKNKPIYNRLISLAKEGKWQILYEDDKSAVFGRMNYGSNK